MALISVEIEHEKEEMNIAKKVVSYFNASDAWRTDYKDDWDDYYEHYRFYRNADDHTQRSNLYVPHIFAACESVTPKLLNTVFNASPIMSITPREEGDEDLAWIIERYLDFAFQDEELDLYTSMEDFFKESSIYGTSFLKVLPRFDAHGDLDFIDADPIDVYKIYPDPYSRSIKKANWIIHRDWIDYYKLLEMAKQGFYKKGTVEELELKFDPENIVEEFKRERLQNIGRESNMGYDVEKNAVEVLEYWDKNEVISVAGRDIVLKREPNPFHGLLPFIMSRYATVPHEFYGIGIPEMAASLQDELNNLRNLHMDNMNIIINRMFVANRYADIDFENLISYPGNVILTDDVESVVPLVTPDVSKSAINEQDRLMQDIQHVIGQFDYDKGMSPRHQGETATGIIRLQQASNIRFDSIVKRIEFTALRSLAKLFIWYARHFMDPDKMAMIVGEKEWQKRNGARFFELTPQEILRQYHVQPMGSSTTAVKELRAQQMMQLYQVWNGDPFIDQYELRVRLANSMDVKGIDKLIKTEQEAAAAQQAAQTPGPPGAAGGGMPGPPPEGAAPAAPATPETEAVAQGGVPAGMGGMV